MCGTKNRTKIFFFFFWNKSIKLSCYFSRFNLRKWAKIFHFLGAHSSPMWSTRSSCWSLKTKWGAIKHDITKFIYCYDSMLSLNELGTSLEDVLQKTLEPTSTQRLNFCMHSFWLFLKDIPRWVDIETKLEKKPFHEIENAND